MRNLARLLAFVTVFAVFAGSVAISGTASAQEPTPVPTVKANKDWVPVTQTFDGVEMVLVPPGCFQMGSTDAQVDEALAQAKKYLSDVSRPWFEDEAPIHSICFDKPFWIDKYEVTNGQFGRFSGKAARPSNWKDDNLPREQITWVESRDFCALRGARLPTEAEWEYAARGPDGLVYPWGNVYEKGRANIDEENSAIAGGVYLERTAPVGSYGGGVSWVGAFDLSGNVWEWVSSLYQAYPYKADDGRENKEDTKNMRVLRGGSWFDYAFNARAVYRARDNSGPGFDESGFRCARDY